MKNRVTEKSENHWIHQLLHCWPKSIATKELALHIREVVMDLKSKASEAKDGHHKKTRNKDTKRA